MSRDTDRRRFLASTACAGAMVLAGAGPARAFRIQPMDADTARSLGAACGGSADDHARRRRLLAEANALLPEGERLPPATLDAILARTACPVCGCPLGSPADGG